MAVTIPKEKLEAVLNDCQGWLSRSRIDNKTVQAIVGRLIYISGCVTSGRKFTTRILGTLRAMGENTWTTITEEFRADLLWFASYAEKSNGLYLIDPPRSQFDIKCDTSLPKGNIEMFIQDITEVLHQIPKLHEFKLYVTGDWNIPYNDTNSPGYKMIVNFCSKFGLSQEIGQPTRCTKNT